MTRDDVAAAVVLAVSLLIMANTALTTPAQWPWIWVAWASAVPFLVLLAPAVQIRLRTLFAKHPGAVVLIPAVWSVAGVAVALLSGVVAGWRLLAWPLATALAILAAGRLDQREPGGWRLLGGALALGLSAGAWDRAFKIPVPGNTSIGLTFFLAVALGLLLYRAARPLSTLDVRLALPARELGLALAGFAVVTAVALPVGFATDFVVLNPRLPNAGFALARLLGLVVFVGIPEEMLFRGMIQEGISRLRGGRVGWIAGSIVFGLAHITKGTGLTALQRTEAFGLNWRYALLATIAGLGYGWVYRRTGRVSAAAVTHGAVDWLWSSYFGR